MMEKKEDGGRCYKTSIDQRDREEFAVCPYAN